MSEDNIRILISEQKPKPSHPGSCFSDLVILRSDEKLCPVLAMYNHVEQGWVEGTLSEGESPSNYLNFQFDSYTMWSYFKK